MNTKKRHIYAITTLLILIIGIFTINALVDKNKAWHSANTDIKIKIDSADKTLQEAIDGNLFTGTHTYALSSELPNPGHTADEIWVSVKDGEMTLLQALQSTNKLYSADPIKTTYNPTINPSHLATEIEVSIEDSPKSLQDAIDDGNFQEEPVEDFNNTITTVDSAGNVGLYTSITIGSDNLPIVSYSDYNYDLKILKCGNNACTSGNTITTIDSIGDVGRFSSITIGSDNLPIVSYSDSTNTALKILKCGNNACTSGNTITTADSAGNVGLYTSITIGSDNLPIVSYHDSTNTALKILKCGNNACTSGNTITTADSIGSVGFYSSITIGADNFPVVSYFYYNHALKILKCGNNACTSGNTITTVDGTTYQGVGYDTSITIGSDNLPIVSYYDSTSNILKILKCGNNACTSGNTITTIDSIGSVGFYTSITIGSDNLPIVSYYDSNILKILKCGNNACTSGNTITTVDSAGNVGQYSSITIGSDNLPIVSYYDSTNRDLKILKCGTDACLYS